LAYIVTIHCALNFYFNTKSNKQSAQTVITGGNEEEKAATDESLTKKLFLFDLKICHKTTTCLKLLIIFYFSFFSFTL